MRDVLGKNIFDDPHQTMCTGIAYHSDIVPIETTITFAINGENLLNSDWNEAQFATETRLKGENKSVTELCYTPDNPQNFQFSVSYKF